MSRILVDRRIRWDLLRAQGADLLLVAAIAVIGLSYGLGYRLDWSEENGRPEEDNEVAEIAAPASLASIGPAPAPVPAPLPPTAAVVAAPPPPVTIGPPPAPAPAAMRADPRETEWENMTSELAKMSARYPGRVSIYLKDLKSGRTWMHHPDDLFPAASLIKVPVMIAAFYKIRDGQLALDERMAITRRNRVGGSGSLKWRPDGTKLSVRELLIHMINESDNTATKMLLDRLGIGYVQQQFPRMGLLYTGIYEEGMSIKGGRVMHENYTTAREMSALMDKIYNGQAVDKVSSEVMLEILKKPKAVASRLAKGMPAGWEIAHKTGLLRQACHDSAIFLTPNGDYAITVLTGQNRSYSQAKDFITKVAKVTFKHYAGPQYYAKATRRRARASR
ncbi:MAG: class A beta-lactamase-related serine hydrolase [Elusimicrobiota bacterium]|nr:MAG: class A beta-lactamase-related serine hydrolase [Elusimicrobiota bacterium]